MTIGGDSRARAGLVCLILLVVTVGLYWPVRHYEFVQYDDPDYVFENRYVRDGLTHAGLMWSLVDVHSANWHPLTWLSHMLDCQLFGLRAGAHHLVNVVLHGANAALLFLLLRAMTGAFWRSAFVAAVFAWHPLRVESVAWISERKDVLSGLFFMLTLWAYAVYVKRSQVSSLRSPDSLKSQVSSLKSGNSVRSSPDKSGPCELERLETEDLRLETWDSLTPHASRGILTPSVFYRLSLLCFTLGLLAKPMLVTVPGVLLFLDFWPLNRFRVLGGSDTDGASPEPSFFHRVRGLLLEKVPFVLLALGVGLLTFVAQKWSGAVVSLKSEGILARLGSAVVGYLGYLEKLFCPRDLSVLYLRPPSVPVLPLALALVVLVSVSVVAGVNLRRRPYLAVGWLWFLGMLLPVCGLVQAGLQSMADRYTYLSGIGLALMLAWGGAELAAALVSPRARPGLLAVTAGAILFACGGVTRYQLAYWQNSETLWTRVLQLDPNNYIAHANLGVYYSKQGKTEAARFHHQRVRELDPALAPHSATNGLPTTGAQK